jgi:hypothetical protein
MRNETLQPKLPKCVFGKQKVAILDHNIVYGWSEPNDQEREFPRGLKEPKSEIKRFPDYCRISVVKPTGWRRRPRSIKYFEVLCGANRKRMKIFDLTGTEVREDGRGRILAAAEKAAIHHFWYARPSAKKNFAQIDSRHNRSG